MAKSKKKTQKTKKTETQDITLTDEQNGMIKSLTDLIVKIRISDAVYLSAPLEAVRKRYTNVCIKLSKAKVRAELRRTKLEAAKSKIEKQLEELE